MNEQKIEDLKNALKEIMQLIVQRGQPLTDEEKTNLAQVMEHVASRIQQLRQEQQQEVGKIEEQQAPTELPPLPPGPQESSNIHSFKYDPKSQQLVIKFQDEYPGTNGPEYLYQGVPQHIFNLLRTGAVPPRTSGSNAWHTWKEGVAPSLGASAYALIKQGGYQYEKLS
jgi:hypothetical protein